MTETKKSYGLLIKKKEEDKEKLKDIGQVASAFANSSNSDSDSEGASKKLTASERFDKKYSSHKAKRLIEQSIAEDPSIFEYDEVYDQLKRTRDCTEEQKKADKDKKPKYVQNIIKAHERRELQKLIHDEHVYKKDRENEGDIFKDKEAFVTESYKKQIAERNAFREKIEREDALDDMLDVKNQQMWQQAFHRKMLNNITDTEVKKENISDIASDPSIKMEIVPENINNLFIKKEDSETTDNPSTSREVKNLSEKKKLLKKSESKRESRSDRTDKSNKRDKVEKDCCIQKDSHKHHKSSHDRDYTNKHHRHKTSHNREYREHKDSSRKRRRSSKDRSEKSSKTRSENYRNRSPIKSNNSEVSYKNRRRDGRARSPTKDEMAARMKRIRSILARRNSDEAIDAARQRYFERQANNTVTLPI